MVAIITIVQHLLVLSVAHLLHKMLPMISVLKVGDFQPITNKVVLLAMSPLSPLYIAGTTAMARSTLLAPTVAGGLLLRSLTAFSTACATTVVAYLPSATARASGSLYGAYGLARAR